MMFQGDRPLKKKVKKFASHHDHGLAEPHQCQSLWVIRSVSNKKENSKRPILDTVLDVGFSEGNPISSTKKQKAAPSDASTDEEGVGLVLPYHQPNVSINQLAPSIIGMMQADIKKLRN
jgi:hypothetical protein